MTLDISRRVLRHARPLAAIVAASAAVCILATPATAQQQARQLPTFTVDAS